MHIELVQVWVFLSFSTWSKILSNIHVCKKIKVNKDFQSWVTSAEAYNYGSIWRESKKNDNCNTCTQIPECNRWTIIHIKLRKSVILMKDIKKHVKASETGSGLFIFLYIYSCGKNSSKFPSILV